MKRELESHITARIMKRLRVVPRSFVVKIGAGPWQIAGLPDVLYIADGRVAWFEVKRPGMKATPLQAATMRVLAIAGCVTGIVHDVVEMETLLTSGGIRIE